MPLNPVGNRQLCQAKSRSSVKGSAAFWVASNSISAKASLR